MVATGDVGRVAAQLLQKTWTGVEIVELEGPRRVTPNGLADAFSRIVQRRVAAKVIDRDTWETLFRTQGMKNTLPRMRMLDGFNEGWICFEGKPADILRGDVELDTVLRALAGQGV